MEFDGKKMFGNAAFAFAVYVMLVVMFAPLEFWKLQYAPLAVAAWEGSVILVTFDSRL